MGLVPQQLIPRFDTSFDRFLILVYSLCLLPMFFLLWAERKHQKQLRTNPRGCKKLGLRGYSNLSDEHHLKYSKTDPWRIKALFVHPIKSCAAVELNTADLSSTGLTWDRQFCFAEWTIPTLFPSGTPDSEKKQARWTLRTLRNPGYEKLVHVRPELWVPDPESVRTNRISDPDPDGVLVINYPNIPRGTLPKRLLLQTGKSLHLVPQEKSFRVPLLPPAKHNYPLERISIWIDTPLALNYGQHIPADFKSYLEIPTSRPFTLFRASPAHYREIHRNAPRHGTTAGELPYQPITAFADQQPLHLLNLASVRDVASRVTHTIPRLSARRFRPNILVTGPGAWDEDDWKRVRIHPRPPPPPPTTPTSEPKSSENMEPVDFHTACHTLRCRLPNVDPSSGNRHPSEPDRTLKSFRCIDRGDQKNAALGLHLIPASAGAAEAEGEQMMRLRVGDEVEVLERGELVYVRY